MGIEMLIDFVVANFKSFRDSACISMVAAAAIKERRDDNMFACGRKRLLKSAAVFGANASGKSNLLEALVTMRYLVISSTDNKVGQGFDTVPFMISPFRFDAQSRDQPTTFDVRFRTKSHEYRYGFSVSSHDVVSEWLIAGSGKREVKLFERTGMHFDIADAFAEARGIESRTRENVLFLSAVAQWGGQTAIEVVQWFERIVTLHGLMAGMYSQKSLSMLRDDARHQRLVEFLRTADLGIHDLKVTDTTVTVQPTFKRTGMDGAPLPGLRSPTLYKEIRVSSIHPVFKGSSVVEYCEMDFETESMGTQQFFQIAGELMGALDEGLVVVADELDSRLHPHLVSAVVRLFNSAATNGSNSQLVFVSHDATLLDFGNLRRDQVWFVEKSSTGASDLYSLAEVKLSAGSKVRNDTALARNYIRGRFGGVPDISRLSWDTFHGDES